MSHIPIHPQSMNRWKLNVHGHTHDKLIQSKVGEIFYGNYSDPRYRCVSMEQINYTPIDLMEIINGL
jgi:calcineurin-like phosphoesterase family protein